MSLADAAYSSNDSLMPQENAYEYSVAYEFSVQDWPNHLWSGYSWSRCD